MNDVGGYNNNDCQVVCANNANEYRDCEVVGNTRGKQMKADQNTQRPKKTKIVKGFRLMKIALSKIQCANELFQTIKLIL